MKRIKPVLAAVIGTVVFAYCVHILWTSFQWREIAAVLRHAKIGSFVAGSIVTTMLYWALRAWRWQVLLKVTDESHINALALYMSTACSLAFALITPFQSGEALKVELLRKHGGLGRFNGYAAFAVERFLDLLVVMLLALLSVLLDSSWGVSPRVLAVSAACLLAGAVALLVWSQRSPVLNTRLRAVQATVISMSASPGRLFFATALTLAAWLTVALGWAWCLTCIGITPGPLQAVGLTTAMTLVNILSFIPGAVGVSEAGIAAALVRLGHAEVLAQSGALIIRAYGVAALVLGSLHFLAWQRLGRPAVATENRA